MNDLFINVGQRHIGQVHIIMSVSETHLFLADLARNKVHMRQHGKFGLSCGSRRNPNHKNVVFTWLVLYLIKHAISLADHVVERVYMKPYLSG